MQKATSDVAVHTIASGKFRRYAHLSIWGYLRHPSIMAHNTIDLFKVATGYVQSLALLVKFRPDVVFAKGGFVCLPMGLAAATLRVPLVVHDSDVRPGLTNRVIARFAAAIATGFPLEHYAYPASRSTYTGVPIDSAYAPVSTVEQLKYKQQLGFATHTSLVMAFGGGLGSAAINDAAVELARTLGSEIQVYNATGAANLSRAKQQGKGLKNYRPEGFVPGLHDIMAAADIVVTRASATALQELAGMGKPTIAVPAHQLGDQQKNAALYEAAGAVEVLRDDELLGRLPQTVRNLLHDDKKRAELARALHTFARPHASRQIAEIIQKAANK